MVSTCACVYTCTYLYLTIGQRLDHMVDYYSHTFDLHHPQLDDEPATTLECNNGMRW